MSAEEHTWGYLELQYNAELARISLATQRAQGTSTTVAGVLTLFIAVAALISDSSQLDLNSAERVVLLVLGISSLLVSLLFAALASAPTKFKSTTNFALLREFYLETQTGQHDEELNDELFECLSTEVGSLQRTCSRQAALVITGQIVMLVGIGFLATLTMLIAN